MRHIVFDKEKVGKFLIEQGAWIGATDHYQGLGIEEDGQLIAGVVYDSYEEGARISSHCAGIGKRWLNKTFLHMMFDYPFNQLKVNVVINTVSSNNKDSMRFTEHLGFKQVARIEGGASDGDLIIYALYKKDCKWIGN